MVAKKSLARYSALVISGTMLLLSIIFPSIYTQHQVAEALEEKRNLVGTGSGSVICANGFSFDAEITFDVTREALGFIVGWVTIQDTTNGITLDLPVSDGKIGKQGYKLVANDPESSPVPLCHAGEEFSKVIITGKTGSQTAAVNVSFVCEGFGEEGVGCVNAEGRFTGDIQVQVTEIDNIKFKINLVNIDDLREQGVLTMSLTVVLHNGDLLTIAGIDEIPADRDTRLLMVELEAPSSDDQLFAEACAHGNGFTVCQDISDVRREGVNKFTLDWSTTTTTVAAAGDALGAGNDDRSSNRQAGET